MFGWSLNVVGGDERGKSNFNDSFEVLDKGNFG